MEGRWREDGGKMEGREDGGKTEGSGREDGGKWEKGWREVGGKWEKGWREVGGKMEGEECSLTFLNFVTEQEDVIPSFHTAISSVQAADLQIPS